MAITIPRRTTGPTNHMIGPAGNDFPFTISSQVDWSNCRLADGGWAYRQDREGFTLEGTLYASTPVVFPHRGDKLPSSGPCAVPSDFASYHVAEVEMSPLTKNGPFTARVTARPTTLDTDSTGSKKRERNSILSVQRFSVRSELVSSPDWSGKRSIPCQVCRCSWYRASSSKLGAPPQHGIVTSLPSWTGALSGTWVLREATAEMVKDNNGVTDLRKVNATFYRPCHFNWKTGKFSKISFNSL